MKVLVLGATGFLGGAAAWALHGAGVDVTCARRRRSNILGVRALPKVELDLDAPETIGPAVADADVIVHAAGFYPKDTLDPAGSRRRAMAQLEALLEALRPEQRLVYVSSTATVAPRFDGTPSDEGDVYEQEPTFGLYHDVKWALEQRVAEHANTVVVCPSGVLGPGDWRVGTCALLVALGRGMDPPHPDGLVSLVDIRDVADVLVRVSTMRSPPPRLIVSGVTRGLHPLLVELAERYRVPKPSPPLSALTATLYADAEEASAAGTSGRARLAREIVDLVVHGVALDASAAFALLGRPPTPLRDTLDHFDAWARRARLLPVLSEPPHAPA